MPPGIRNHDQADQKLRRQQRMKTRIFWFFFAIAGIALFFFALKLAAGNDFGGFAAFAMYLVFLLLIIFAFRDSEQITMLPPDQDEENNDPALFTDYLAQIEWRQTHRRGKSSEPKWRYRAVSPRSATGDFGLLVVLPAMIPILALAYFYGANSTITLTVAIALGLVGICVFLIVQDSRN